MLAESVKALLMDKGSIFGDYTRTEFSDSILRENVDSISIQDVSCNVKVQQSSYSLCLCNAVHVLSCVGISLFICTVDNSCIPTAF